MIERMMGQQLLTEKDAARFLGTSIQFLRKHRHQGTIPGKVEGPPWIRVGSRAIRYAVSDLEEYINGRRGIR